MIVWCRECKTNVAPLDWDRCSACVVKPSPMPDLYFEEDIIPERCAGYFSPEAIAERWPNPNPFERAYSTLSEMYAELNKLWTERTPRYEWNTVNLKELREEWQSRRWAMSSEGWQRLKDRQKYVF